MRLRRKFTLTVIAFVAVLALIACGDDDDDADSGSTATLSAATPTVVVDASPTDAPGAATVGLPATATVDESNEGAGDAATPTDGTSDASPTPDITTSTPTDESEPTSEATADDGVSTPDATEPVSGVDAALMPILLTEADLPDDWEIDDDAGPVDVDDTDGEELCATDGFPDEAASTGQVMAQYGSESPMLVMLQKVWAFDGTVASDAFAFWRDSTGCGEWAEDDETTVTVEPLDDPGLGEESFAVHVVFDAGEGQMAQGDYVFVRSGGLLMLIAYLSTEDADFTQLAGPIETATERLLEVAGELASE